MPGREIDFCFCMQGTVTHNIHSVDGSGSSGGIIVFVPQCLKAIIYIYNKFVHIFDLFIRGLPEEARHAAMLCYDVTLVMRIPTGKRETGAALLSSDIERIPDFGKKWLLEFEAKTKPITISKKRIR